MQRDISTMSDFRRSPLCAFIHRNLFGWSYFMKTTWQIYLCTIHMIQLLLVSPTECVHVIYIRSILLESDESGMDTGAINMHYGRRAGVSIGSIEFLLEYISLRLSGVSWTFFRSLKFTQHSTGVLSSFETWNRRMFTDNSVNQTFFNKERSFFGVSFDSWKSPFGVSVPKRLT